MLKLIASALLVSAVALGVSQENKPISDAGVVTCDNLSTDKNTSKWVSSDAGFSAKVELKASVLGLGDHRRCVTSWKLHVRGKDRKEKVLTIADREDSPGDNEWVQENSFEINGWSKDGQLVLTSQIESQGDWDETNPVIYDFASGKFWRVNLFSLLRAESS